MEKTTMKAIGIKVKEYLKSRFYEGAIVKITGSTIVIDNLPLMTYADVIVEKATGIRGESITKSMVQIPLDNLQ